MCFSTDHSSAAEVDRPVFSPSFTSEYFEAKLAVKPTCCLTRRPQQHLEQGTELLLIHTSYLSQQQRYKGGVHYSQHNNEPTLKKEGGKYSGLTLLMLVGRSVLLVFLQLFTPLTSQPNLRPSQLLQQQQYHVYTCCITHTVAEHIPLDTGSRSQLETEHSWRECF